MFGWWRAKFIYNKVYNNSHEVCIYIKIEDSCNSAEDGQLAAAEENFTLESEYKNNLDIYDIGFKFLLNPRVVCGDKKYNFWIVSRLIDGVAAGPPFDSAGSWDLLLKDNIFMKSHLINTNTIYELKVSNEDPLRLLEYG